MVSGRGAVPALRRSSVDPAPLPRRPCAGGLLRPHNERSDRSRRGLRPTPARTRRRRGPAAPPALRTGDRRTAAAVSSPRAPRTPDGVGPDRLPIHLPLPRSPMSPSSSRRRAVVTGTDVPHALLLAAPQAPVGADAPVPSPPPAAQVSAPPAVLGHLPPPCRQGGPAGPPAGRRRAGSSRRRRGGASDPVSGRGTGDDAAPPARDARGGHDRQREQPADRSPYQ